MHYTEAKGGDFYVRGLDAVTTDFGIFVRIDGAPFGYIVCN